MNIKPLSHIIKGVIIATIIIIVGTVIEKNGIPTIGFLKLLPTLLIIIGVIISVILFAKQQKTAAFGDLFSHGFRTAAIIICLLAAYTFVVAKWFTPNPSPAEREAYKKEIIANGHVMPQEAETKVNEAIKNRWVFLVAQSIFATLVAGALGAGTGALIASKKTNNP